MPTIESLAPATSASDSDEFVVSQANVLRKVTRAQILNGVQTAITVPAGSLLGNSGTSLATPSAITVGRNLTLSGSTLTATASAFVIKDLLPATAPASDDLIPISQHGTSFALSYGQFLSGLSGLENVNLTQGLVTPAGATTAKTLGNLTANLLPLSGGTLTGPLALAGSPTGSVHAVNKNYVDGQIAAVLPLTGGSLSGTLVLAGTPHQVLDAASKGYVDRIAVGLVPSSGASLAGALFLSGDPAVPLQASTKRYTDLKLARTGDTLAGPLILAAEPVAPRQAATKNYVDTQTLLCLPKAGGTLLGSLFLASDPINLAQATTKQYVDQKVSRAGDTLAGPLCLAADPTMGTHAATKNYVDGKFLGAIARSGSSLTGALLLATDPATPLQAATKQYVDLRLSRNGDSLTGALMLAADPVVPLQAATKHYVDHQFATTLTAAGATFKGAVVLAGSPNSANEAATKQYVDAKLSRSGDTLVGALVLTADPVVPLQAATKNYVDQRSSTMLPRSGGTLTGSLSLTGDPTVPTHAATKQYVDNKILTAMPITGGSLTGALSLGGSPTADVHAANKLYVDSQVGAALLKSGGTASGPIVLAGPPTAPLHAATKAYVDANPTAEGVINIMLPPYNAKIDGLTDDTPAFKAAYQAAAAGTTIYVPSGTTVLKQPSTWGVALNKRVRWLVAGTVLSDGTPLAAAIPTGGAPGPFVLPGFVAGNTPSGNTTSQGASQPTDFAVDQSSYIVNHNGGSAGTVICNVRSDTIIYNSPGNYVWGGLDRLIWAGTQAPSATVPAQHVGRYIQTLRQSATSGSNGQFLPQPQLWGACIEYRDTTGQNSSATNAALTIEMDWFGNGLDDANTRTIQSLVIGQHNTAGPAVEVSNIIGVYLSAGSSGSVKTVFAIGVPFSNAVVDTTYARSINSAPVIKMSAGQAIAFEGTNSNRLLYDQSTNTLRWNQGSLSYPVGKGISVGSVNTYSSSATLPNYTSGNLIFLTGSSPYVMTLPPANTVAAGTGFTFSVLGTGAVRITPTGSDTIDSSPIVLHTNDRYHIVSDGSSSWRELFWTNAVSPRFLGPIVLPSYTVTSLPGGVSAGAKAFASNGRKPAEAVGAGSGVEVFFDGLRWISSCSGTAVAG